MRFLIILFLFAVQFACTKDSHVLEQVKPTVKPTPNTTGTYASQAGPKKDSITCYFATREPHHFGDSTLSAYGPVKYDTVYFTVKNDPCEILNETNRIVWEYKRSKRSGKEIVPRQWFWWWYQLSGSVNNANAKVECPCEERGNSNGFASSRSVTEEFFRNKSVFLPSDTVIVK